MAEQRSNTEQQINALREENTRLRSTVEELLSVVSTIREELAELREENLQLKEEIRVLKTPKNSSNSSLPPSSDIVPRTRSLRQNQGKKPGGQPGHQGSTLKMTAVADQTEDHLPVQCEHCGEDLSSRPGDAGECRWQIDLPPVRPVVTAHRLISKTCACGQTSTGSFPPQVRASLSYGPGIEALVAYLSVRQYLPYGRIAEVLRDSYGVKLSCGTIARMLQRFASKGDAAYQGIRQELLGAQVVGSDETGARVNGRTQWMHTWQNQYSTFLICHPNRGDKAIKEYFPSGFPLATLVSDCLAGQLATPAAAHQLCTAPPAARTELL